MEALASTTCRCTTIRLKTNQATEFLDITDELKTLVRDSGMRMGFVNIQSLHTTAAIIVNENEPLLMSDFLTALENAAPSTSHYRHDDLVARTVNLAPDERVNGHAHCRALFLPSSACINVIDGTLRLGVWQRIFLVELDGPRHRELSVMVVGEAWR